MTSSVLATAAAMIAVVVGISQALCHARQRSGPTNSLVFSTTCTSQRTTLAVALTSNRHNDHTTRDEDQVA